MPARKLLLNWVYYFPVGHAVEAFKTAKGLWNANEDVEIHLLLNRETPIELASACDWIARTYPVDLAEFTELNADPRCLRDIPTEWDFVVTDHRPYTSPFPFAHPLRNFHDHAEQRFTGRLWKGGHHLLRRGGGPGYEPNATIRMQVPETARNFARALPAGRIKIVVLPAGSSPEPIYPAPDWWHRALSALAAELPDAHFFLTGKTTTDDRSSTLTFSRGAIDRLTASCERTFDCFDIGLWNQLALLEWCDLLIAPHTGFAFLAPSLGTPWLSISGVRWPECYFNDVPFYCVLPQCDKYPCWLGMLEVCTERLATTERVLCMNEELDGRVPDLVAGARLLLSDGFSYSEAMALHNQRIDARFPRERFFQIV